MRRRRFLAGSGTALSSVVAGCVGRSESPETPPGIAVESAHWDGSVLEAPDREWAFTTPTSYETIVDDRDAAADAFVREREIGAFLDGTDFSASYLAVVIAGWWPSDVTLVARRVERGDRGVRLGIGTDYPDGAVGQDASLHSLVTRVTDDRSATPDALEVDFDGG